MWHSPAISITFGDGSSGAWLRPRELSVCIGLQQIGDRLQGNRCVFTMPSQKLLNSSESETDILESSWIILNLFSIRLMTMTHVITMIETPPAVPVLNSSSWRNPSSRWGTPAHWPRRDGATRYMGIFHGDIWDIWAFPGIDLGTPKSSIDRWDFPL